MDLESWARDDSVSETMSNMLLSAAGTGIGYKVGELTKGTMASFTNSFRATLQSKPTGFLTIEGPHSRSAWPSTMGNMSGSGATEFVTLSSSSLKIYLDQIRLTGAEK